MSGRTERSGTEIPIDEEGQFSWGGEGEGHPVEGAFESDTTASGTVKFMPNPGPDEAVCEAISAEWEARR